MSSTAPPGIPAYLLTCDWLSEIHLYNTLADAKDAAILLQRGLTKLPLPAVTWSCMNIEEQNHWHAKLLSNHINIFHVTIPFRPSRQ